MQHSRKIIILPLFVLALLFTQCKSGNHRHSGTRQHQPKLVVGIVVDQMRYDFLYRYWYKYGDGGFKRLLKQGFLCSNTNITYVPTNTGPGHAAIYTGTGPATNGIIGNNWYSRKLNKSIYCVGDSTVNPVGSGNKKEGKMSPRNLLTNTITDQLRLSTNMQSKTIGISLKDRGSILPAGHSATGAYWYDGIAGDWITSSFYMDSLPKWVNKFNEERQPVKFLNQTWDTYLPIKEYTESTKDNSEYEDPFKGEVVPVFPYHLWPISGNSYDLLRETPFGNTYTKNFAEAAIKGEQMGKGDFTDFLAVSFSSTDYIGHRFGPNSIEIEDTYIRLDKDLEEFFNFLDSYLGKDNVLVFLTADHGAANNPKYMKDLKEPAGFFNPALMTDSLNNYLRKIYLTDTSTDVRKKSYHRNTLVQDYENQEIYLNLDTLKLLNINHEEICEKIYQKVLTFPGVSSAILAKDLEESNFTSGPFHLIQQGFMPARSGDVAVVLQPGWIEYKSKGTTHGSGHSYDTHIPLIFYGWNIKPGSTQDQVSIIDIAPTIAALLQIQAPSGSTGKPIEALFR